MYLTCFPLPNSRSSENYEVHLKVRHWGNHCVKTASAVLDIPHYDIIKKCPKDYMHNVCLGAITFRWFDSKHHSLRALYGP